MAKLIPGKKAPAFKGLNENNEEVTLDDFKGKKLVLYFYPKDNTPTCTTESCNLRDNYNILLKKGFQVLGISPDSVKKHQNFIKKYNLPFSLIADTDQKICKQYGVWGQKTLFGISYMGVIRTTFVIDENGVIEKIINKVEAKNHTAQIV